MKLKSVFALLIKVFDDGLKKNRRNLISILLLTLVSSGWGILAPYILQDFIDEIAVRRNPEVMLYHIFAFTGSLFMFGIFWAWQIKIATKLSCSLFYELRLGLLRTVLQKPIDFFRKFKNSDIISRVLNDVDFMENFFYYNIISGATFLISCILMSFFILFWHWELGSILFISLSLYFSFVLLLYGPLFRLSQQAREDLSAQNEVILDLISGFREIKIFQQIISVIDRLEKAAGSYQSSNRKFIRYSDYIFIATESLGIFVSALPLLIGGFILIRGGSSITIGVLVSYFALSSILMSNFRVSLEALNKLFQCSAPLARIEELQDEEEEQIEISSIDEIPSGSVIEFRNVSFGYDEGKNLFRNFNLTIRENEKIAIIGPSGTGKSTLLNLLIGFVRPDSGQVLFGGKETTSYPRNLYFNYFSYITQWNHIFKVSIKDNIAMGWYSVPMEEIKKIALLVKLEETIKKFPEHYNTIIGSDRVVLSGGEQQRIAFARAMLRDPKVLLLDEFTAALDKDTEKELLDDVFDLFKNKTIICVTHSKELASRFDRIIEITPLTTL